MLRTRRINFLVTVFLLVGGVCQFACHLHTRHWDDQHCRRTDRACRAYPECGTGDLHFNIHVYIRTAHIYSHRNAHSYTNPYGNAGLYLHAAYPIDQRFNSHQLPQRAGQGLWHGGCVIGRRDCRGIWARPNG